MLQTGQSPQGCVAVPQKHSAPSDRNLQPNPSLKRGEKLKRGPGGAASGRAPKHWGGKALEAGIHKSFMGICRCSEYVGDKKGCPGTARLVQARIPIPGCVQGQVTAAWDRLRCPCPWQGWHWMDPSHPSHSGILGQAHFECSQNIRNANLQFLCGCCSQCPARPWETQTMSGVLLAPSPMVTPGLQQQQLLGQGTGRV